MSRKPLIAGNWKLNHMTGPAVETASALKGMVAGVTGAEIVICPVFTVLDAVGRAIAGSNIALGGQNCYTKESGAFTGEISPQMLADVGCTWVIIGHSERRQLFGEQDALLNEKLRYALSVGLSVMFCIGETLQEREGGQMNAVLERQVVEGLKGLVETDFDRVAIAYEPIWAIGTGKTATSAVANRVCGLIVRGTLAAMYGEQVAQAIRVQYGGSANEKNIGELMAMSDIDGALIGGASIKVEAFVDMVRITAAQA